MFLALQKVRLQGWSKSCTTWSSIILTESPYQTGVNSVSSTRTRPTVLF
jgi:hypothetical protein